MAARNFFGGMASLFLMIAKIILCLLFAVCDRLQADWRERPAAPNDELPAIGVLGT